MTIRWLKWALKKYGPDILTGMTLGGIALTSVLSAKAGMNAEREILAAIVRRNDGQELCGCLGYGYSTPDEVPSYDENVLPMTLTLKERAKLTWKLFIPPFASAIVTGACAIGCHKMHLSKEMVLGMTASIAAKNYNKLDTAARKTLGDKYREVQEAVASEEAKDIPPWLPQPKPGETLYYEPISEQYFCATPQAMLYAQLHINKVLHEYWGVTLNDYLNVLPGCHRVPYGSDMGWYLGTDTWMELWTSWNQSGGGEFIDIEFVDMPDSPAKRIWYSVYPGEPDEDWEPAK